MPKEYTSGQNVPAAPTPSDFGSGQMDLQTPQFTAQLGVKAQENPFQQLQGVLKEAVGATTAYMQDKESQANIQIAAINAEYTAKQRAYAEAERIERDAKEEAQRQIVSIDTSLNRLWAVDDYQGAQSIINERRKKETDPLILNKLSEAELQGQEKQRQAEYRAEREQDEAGALFAPALKQGIEAEVNTISASEKDLILRGLPSQFSDVPPKELHGVLFGMLQKTMGPEYWMMTPQQRADMDLHISNNVGSLMATVTEARGDEYQRRENIALIEEGRALGSHLKFGSTKAMDDRRARILKAQSENRISPQQADRFLIEDARTFGATYNKQQGFVGVVGATKELEARFAEGKISEDEFRAGMIQVNARAREDVKGAIAATLNAAITVDPTSASPLASIGKRASDVVLERLGVKREDVESLGLDSQLNAFDEKQAGDIRMLEADKAKQVKQNNLAAVLGYDTSTNEAFGALTRGDKTKAEALSKKFEEEMKLYKDNPTILNAISDRKLALDRRLADKSDDIKALRTKVDIALRTEAETGSDEAIINAMLDLKDMAEKHKGNVHMSAAIERERLHLAKEKKRYDEDPDNPLNKTYKETTSREVWDVSKDELEHIPAESRGPYLKLVFDSMSKTGGAPPDAMKRLEVLLEDPAANGEVVIDILTQAGALDGSQQSSRDYWNNAPLAMTLGMLVKVEASSPAMSLGSRPTMQQLVDRNIVIAKEIVEGKRTAFAMGALEEGADPTVSRPLYYSEAIAEAIEEHYGLSEEELNPSSFSVDDKMMFDALFHARLKATGGNNENSLDFAVRSIKAMGYSAVRMSEGGPIDFVQDPYQLIPPDLSSPETILTAKRNAMRWMRENVPGMENLETVDGIEVVFHLDDRFLQSKEGGVPFDIHLDTGQKYLYKKDGPTPVVNNRDQGRLSKDIQEKRVDPYELENKRRPTARGM